MRVRSYDIVMMTKLKMMMKPLRDSPSGAFVMEGKLMAYKPNHPCAHQGCPRLVPTGQKHCEKHRNMHQEDISFRTVVIRTCSGTGITGGLCTRSAMMKKPDGRTPIRCTGTEICHFAIDDILLREFA